MGNRKYYSERKNKSSQKIIINLLSLNRLFSNVYEEFFSQGYLYLIPQDESLETELFSIEELNSHNILPFSKTFEYTEEEVFDLIELFYDYIRTPLRSVIGGNSLGITNPAFFDGVIILTKEEAQMKYRFLINRIVSKYGVGFELTEDGYIRELMNSGLEELIDYSQVLPEDIDSEQRIKNAKKAFFKRGSSDEDKRGAIFTVGTVLEKLRESNQLYLNKKDTGDLFIVLDGFNIRHNRKDQKCEYDKEIFYPWMFYNLLAAVDASFKLLKK